MDELYFTVFACIAGPFHTTSICKHRMSDCTSDPEREDCNEQPDRVGNDGNGANNNDADRDGPGGDDGPNQETTMTQAIKIVGVRSQVA